VPTDTLRRYALTIDGRLIDKLTNGSAAKTPEEAVEMLLITALTATGVVKESSELIRVTGKVKVTALP
jgi:hypothetical protein